MAAPSRSVAVAISVAEADRARLHQLGYKQELKRGLSVVSNFAFSFSLISVLTGVTSTYNTGLRYGGPASMTLGWLVVASFNGCVALSMAEICSAYPTSGGLYYWSAKLAGSKWASLASWVTGWFNIVGQWASTTSVDFSLAQLVQVMVLLGTGGANGGGYKASKYVVLAIYGFILVLHGLINSLPIHWLSWFGQFGAFWNAAGVFVLAILIPAVAKERASVEFIFTHFNTDNVMGVHGKAYILAVGLLMSQYSVIGYDTSAHMTEETKNADRSGPIGIITSVSLATVIGWVYLVALTSIVTDIPYLLSADNDAGGYAIAQALHTTFQRRYGSGVGGLACLGVIAVAMFLCGVACVTSNSRMGYAFSRDGAMPYSHVWHRVSKHEVPLNVVWLSVVVAFAMALTCIHGGDLLGVPDLRRALLLERQARRQEVGVPRLLGHRLVQHRGTGGTNGGGYVASKYVVLAIYGFILILHGLINSLPIHWLSWFGQLGAFWNAAGVFVLVILIPSVAKGRSSADFIFTHLNTDNGMDIHNKAYILGVGLLMSNYCMIGYDTSAHMTEETKNADRSGPIGIVTSVVLSNIFGWIYLVTLTSVVTDIPYLLSVDNDASGYAIAQALYTIFNRRYSSGVGGLLCLGVIAVAMFLCGVACITSNSRMGYAFSRDGAMPYSHLWHRVSKHEVPLNVVWLSVLVAFAMALTSLGSQVAFQAMVSIATLGLYISYALPNFFRVTTARKSFVRGPFHLGRYGVIIGWAAVLWVAFITVLFSLPVAYPVGKDVFNYTPVAVGGVLLLSVGSWVLHAQFWFKGPIMNVDTV